jgi:transitional endoplasmic reticulum ATPase
MGLNSPKESCMPRSVAALSIRGLLWVVVASVFLLSYLFYTPPSSATSGGEGPADWIFPSWPTLFAAALAMWLLLKGPATSAHPLVRKACRLAMFFFLYSGFLYVLQWNPFWKWMLALGFENRNKTEGVLILVSTLVWLAMTLRVLFGGFRLPSLGFGIPALGNRAPEIRTTRPSVTFADVGGMDEAKQQIREIVENRLHPAKFDRYGIVRNGILLHGPRGSGKTFLAEATAGEFRLNYFYVSPTSLFNMWMGNTGTNVREVVRRAASTTPAVLFIDEIDSLGGKRADLSAGNDPGGGGRERNNVTIQLMQCIDEYRNTSGFVLMAATNLLDGLDPALIREGRFDLHIRVDMPDEAVRRGIFEAQLKQKPWKSCDLEEFARRTPGASAAKIKSIVDRAAAIAAQDGRSIEEHDLRKALDETGGRDRPLFKPVQWEDVILEPEVEQELRALVRQMNAGWSEMRSMAVPTGVLLVGPPGTGKTMIGRLIATQTRRSFYPLSAADVLGGQVGASVKRLSEIFARGRENSPSIIFFDEIDGLFPANTVQLSTHDTQVVEQCRTEISQLEPEHNVFLIGTTNHLDRIDPAIKRGGRFSEKIEIPTPGQTNRERLLMMYLKDVKIDIRIDRMAERLAGLAPADIEAVCKSAVRRAFGRSDRDDSIPPLIWDDFEHAIKRGVRYSF